MVGSYTKNEKGFTLLEILLVVAAIAILAGIVIFAINPGKQLGDTRNANRRADVNTVLSAVYQYAIDSGTGAIPAAILTDAACSTAANEICKTGGDCTGLTDLSVLSENEKYVTSLPVDPSEPTASEGTGYFVAKNANGRVTVCAPNAEQSVTISATR